MGDTHRHWNRRHRVWQHLLTIQPDQLDCLRSRGKRSRTRVMLAPLGLQAAPRKWPAAGKLNEWKTQAGQAQENQRLLCYFHLISHRIVGPQSIQGHGCCASSRLAILYKKVRRQNVWGPLLLHLWASIVTVAKQHLCKEMMFPLFQFHHYMGKHKRRYETVLDATRFAGCNATWAKTVREADIIHVEYYGRMTNWPHTDTQARGFDLHSSVRMCTADQSQNLTITVWNTVLQ